MKVARIIILYFTCGFVWWYAMQALFIWSGAQQVLADPTRQSSKFIKVFTEYEPLPRMVVDSSVFWKGFVVCGLFAATAFLIINVYLRGSWWKRGLLFGFVHWCLMAPWFEFYLPYNVMHEPLPLVVMEGWLWLVTLLWSSLYMSFVINFRTTRV